MQYTRPQPAAGSCAASQTSMPLDVAVVDLCGGMGDRSVWFPQCAAALPGPGSRIGVHVCAGPSPADPPIRCVLMTGGDDESVLIESVLAGAWGCLSKLDDSGEQLSLVRRVLAGQTAFSSRFLPGLLGQVSGELTVRRRRSRVCRTGKPPSPSVWPEG